MISNGSYNETEIHYFYLFFILQKKVCGDHARSCYLFTKPEVLNAVLVKSFFIFLTNQPRE